MGKRAVSRLFYYYSILLTLIIGLLAVIGDRAGLYAPEHSTFFCVMALLMPVFVIANFVLVVYWGVRLRIWILIPIVCLYCSSGYLKNILRVQRETPTKNMPKSLVVSTYNVEVFNNEPTGYSCKAIAKYLKDCCVDIACFQELGININFNEDSVRHAMSNWEYVSIPHPADNQSILQIAVFSRYPILNSRLITFRNSSNCSMVCDVLVGKDTLRVINNHLQTTAVRRNKKNIDKVISAYNNEGLKNALFRFCEGLIENAVARGQQADYISSIINESSTPAIVCGDFNSIPSEYAYRSIKGKRLEDGFRMAGSGYMYTYRFLKHLLRIDYIFVPKNFKGYMYASPNLDYSDHKPVIMAMGYE
jgi:endonuclease/exonuclease/phosphatase family metal-dependent hydrolase